MQRCHDCLVAILGISWALTGLETAVFRGHSWSLVVTRGDTKPLANKGLSPNFLRTPNGIRTRAATLKGWSRSRAVLVSLLIKSIVEE